MPCPKDIPITKAKTTMVGSRLDRQKDWKRKTSAECSGMGHEIQRHPNSARMPLIELVLAKVMNKADARRVSGKGRSIIVK